ncbi:hypothetical protein D3C78_1049320 [compost metagenome]
MLAKGSGIKTAAAFVGGIAVGLVDLDPFKPARRRFLHEDVATDICEVRGHLLPIGAQRARQVQCRIMTGDGLWVGGIACQADGRAWNAEADGHFRADRDEVEILSQYLVAESRGLVTAVVANLGTGQAGADSDSGFASGV